MANVYPSEAVQEREALCGETASYAKRLADINSSFESLIGRIGGARPPQTSNSKDPQTQLEPHLKEWSRRVGSEIYSLEQSLDTLRQLIG